MTGVQTCALPILVMCMMNREGSFIMTSKRKTKKQIYCKRCGGKCKDKLNIQLTPSRLIRVCTECFNWASGKTMIEIREDYAARTKRRKG